MMIEINLLTEKTAAKTTGLRLGSFPKEKIIFTASVIIALLVAVHVSLFVVFILKGRQAALLNKKWQELSPQWATLGELKKYYSNQVERGEEPRQIDNGVDRWALRLNSMSTDLPYGVWFNSLSFDAGNFILKGSAVSLEKEELSLINKFMDNLKGNKGLAKDFHDLTLGAVQRRTIGGYDIVDFTLSAFQKK